MADRYCQPLSTNHSTTGLQHTQLIETQYQGLHTKDRICLYQRKLPQAGHVVVTVTPHSSVSRAINPSQYKYQEILLADTSTTSWPFEEDKQPQVGPLSGCTTTS